MHASWTGNLKFESIDISASLVPAMTAKDIEFRTLFIPDAAKQSFKANDENPVLGKEVSTAYKMDDGKYLILDEDELDHLAAANQHFQIDQFVPCSLIDGISFRESFFVVPDAECKKTYALLMRAIEKTGTCGIGCITIKHIQYPAAVWVKRGLLLLSTLHSENEMLDENVVRKQIAGASVDSAKLADTESSILAQVQPLNLSRYADDFRESLIRLLSRKVVQSSSQAEFAFERAQASAARQMEKAEPPQENATARKAS